VTHSQGQKAAEMNPLDTPVVIIGNGPSALDHVRAFEDIEGEKIVVRLNFFFLESGYPFGEVTDYYFWAVNRPSLHEELRKVWQERSYTIKNFMCPVPVDLLDYEDGKVRDDPFWSGSQPKDYWKSIIQNSPDVARAFMSRPLPTIGLQALAYFASEGYRNIHIFGMDFYQSNNARYAYNVPESIANRLGEKHTRPGYEQGAHSLDADLRFLKSIISNYPDLVVNYHGQFSDIDDLISVLSGKLDNSVSKAPRADFLAAVEGIVSEGTEHGDVAELKEILRQTQARVSVLESQYLPELDNKINRRVHEYLDPFFDLLTSQDAPYANVVWVVHEMTSFAGVHRPIKAFLEGAPSHNGARCQVVNLSDSNFNTNSFKMNFIQSQPHTLVFNSIACFEFDEVEVYLQRATSFAIYLHETDWTITNFSQKNPLAYKRFTEYVGKAHVMCVSPEQKKYVLERFNPMSAEVVYNTVDTMLSARQREIRRSLSRDHGPRSLRKIGMVGSYQPRKGSQLFARVSEIICESSENVSFEWVGKLHVGSIPEQHMLFHGPLSNSKTQEFINELDVLFLPSIDDPQPLAALEAMSRGVKVVCYSGIGTASWIKGISGCEVFTDYTPEAASSAILKALDTELDYHAVDQVLKERFDLPVFVDRICDFLDGITPVRQTPESEVPRYKRLLQSVRKRQFSSLLDADKIDEWEGIYSQAINLRKDAGDVNAYFKLVDSLNLKGETDIALEVALWAIRKNPRKASAYRRMASLQDFLGNRKLATEYARIATEMNPESNAAAELLASLLVVESE
jgi:glycosyltransferase involved in cell wall biosynthesis